MRPTSIKHSGLLWVALVVLLVSATAMQVAVEGRLQRPTALPGVNWIQSPQLMRRLTMGFNAIWADIYWIRAVQYYGDTKLSMDAKKKYDRLYPLLDITTTLDPHFNMAYRFGSILLSEGYPNGPGSTEQALALLQKGIRAAPDKWQYYQDAGFVEYWWRRNTRAAADWFVKGSMLPGAPDWLRPLAAGVLAKGGEREASRAMWTILAETGEHEWIRQSARRGLQQLDAESHIETLESLMHRFHDTKGRFPASWDEMKQAGLVRGVPLDPSGKAYEMDSVSGSVDVSRQSTLYPLRSRTR